MSQANLNRTPIWDRAGAVPTAYAVEQAGPTIVAKIENFFYKRLQYHGNVDLTKANRHQPQPKSMNYFAGERKRDLARYTPPDPRQDEGVHTEET